MLMLEFDTDMAEKMYSERSARDPEYQRLVGIYCQGKENGGCRFDPDNEIDDCVPCPHYQSDKERYVLDTLFDIISNNTSVLFKTHGDVLN